MVTKNITDSEDLNEIKEYVLNSKTKQTMATKSHKTQFTEGYSANKFTCKTPNQKKIIKAIQGDDDIVVVSGKPGTGKTFTAIQGVLKEFKKGTYDKIILTKSVKTIDNKSEDLGFLKGGVKEKIEPFMFSFDHNFLQMIDSEIYGIAREHDIVSFLPLAYIRGISITNSLVILDEAQNINNSVLRTILSRIGKGSKLIIIGDTQQKDTNKGQTSGLAFLIKHFQEMNGFNFIEMTKEDQCRSKLINDIEDEYDKLEEQGIQIT